MTFKSELRSSCLLLVDAGGAGGGCGLANYGVVDIKKCVTFDFGRSVIVELVSDVDEIPRHLELALLILSFFDVVCCLLVACAKCYQSRNAALN